MLDNLRIKYKTCIYTCTAHMTCKLQVCWTLKNVHHVKRNNLSMEMWNESLLLDIRLQFLCGWPSLQPGIWGVVHVTSLCVICNLHCTLLYIVATGYWTGLSSHADQLTNLYALYMYIPYNHIKYFSLFGWTTFKNCHKILKRYCN